MSYVPNPDLPTEVYWSRGSLYDSVRSLKGYMTEQLGYYVRQENRKRNVMNRLDPSGIDFSNFSPKRVYQLVNLDGKSVVQWDDITDKIKDDRINHMRAKYE